MTDKVALVRLRAKNDQYDAAMAKSAKLTNDLAATSTKFRGISQELDSVGSTLNRSVTLPLTLAGAASYKLAADFNTTFTRMATLAGVPVDQLDTLKQSVLDLARETGQAPAELAESLYQIYSSGVPASEAMNVLKASAQGAALGLGEAAGVADAITSAINTYGAGNLSAADATDQLTAAVKAGKGEAAAFAPQLGNLLPLASQLGISFADTAGSLAYLTRGGNNAATASTKLEGVMRALVKPTQQGRDVLEQVGLSADKLRQVVAEQGLPAALELLQEKFAGNNELMGKFFEDSEGYIGNLALMKDGGKEWAQVLQEVNDSQGLVAEGMAILQDTPEFRAQQALADLQATMVEVGTALAPILADLAGGIADLAGVFTSLPGPVQAGLVAIGLFAASLGPLVSLAGNAAKAVALFTAAMNARQLDNFRLGLMGVTEAGAGASNALGGFIHSMGGVQGMAAIGGGALIGLGAILYAVADDAQRAERHAAKLEAAIDSVRETAVSTGRSVQDVFSSTTLLDFAAKNSRQLEAWGVSLSDVQAAVMGTDEQYQAFVDSITGTDVSLEEFAALDPIRDLRDEFVGAERETKAVRAAQAELGTETENTAGAQDDLTSATDKATDALSKQADEILGTLDAQRGALDATDAYNQSIVDVAEAQQAEADAAAAVGDAERGVTDARERAAEAAAAIADAERAVEDARKGVADALRNVEKAEQDAADAAQTVADRMVELADAQREATGDSDAMRDALAGVADAEQCLADAQADSLTAQQDLDTARANYSQTLAGLARDAGGAADDVLTAEIRLRDAQRRLAELGQDGKPVTADDRLAAEIAIRDAQRAVETARERAAAAQADLDRNQRNGVEGSDAVAAASQRVADAADNEADAQARLDAAHQAVADAREAANQRVIDAEHNLAEAIDARAEADQRVVDAKDGVVDAQQRVADAIAGVDKANRDAAKATDAIREAQDKVVAAKQAVVDAHAAVEEKIRAVEKAALDAAIAVYGMDGKTRGAEAAARDLAEKLRALAEKMDPNNPLRQYLQDTADELDGISGVYDVQLNLTAFEDSSFAALVSLGPARPGFANTERRAAGGPTKAGRTYLVGEQGPELWTSPADGYVTNASRTADLFSAAMSPSDPGGMSAAISAALAASGGGRTIDLGGIVVHAPGERNPYALATAVSERVAYKVALEEG